MKIPFFIFCSAILAKAGIHSNYFKQQYILWIPAYAGMAPVNIKLGIFKGDEYIFLEGGLEEWLLIKGYAFPQQSRAFSRKTPKMHETTWKDCV